MMKLEHFSSLDIYNCLVMMRFATISSSQQVCLFFMMKKATCQRQVALKR